MIASAVALLALAPAPLNGPAPAPSLVIAADEKPASERFFEAMRPRPLPERLKAIDAVLTDLPRPSPFRSIVVCARAKTMGSLDHSDFKAAAAECYKLMPTAPMALWMYAESRKYEADPRPSAISFIAALQAAPEVSSFLSPGEFERILRELDAMGDLQLSARLLAALNAAGFGLAEPRWSSWAARRSLDVALALGDLAKAAALLPQVLNPEDALPLLIDKQYRAIQAKIAIFAADGLISQRDAYLNAMEGAYQIDDTLSRRLEFAVALKASGKVEDGIGLLKSTLIQKELWGSDRYQIVSVAIRAADMLAEAGRPSEGVDLLRKLDAELVADGHAGPAKNIVPNLARLLIRADRHGEALALLDARAPKAEEFTRREDYAYIPALRACAYAGLGRLGERDRDSQAALAMDADNLSVRRMLIGCRGDLAGAKVEIIRDLALAGRRQPMLTALRRAELGHIQPGSRWDALLREAVSDPEVAGALARYSDPVPSRYVSAFRSWSDSPGEPAR